MPKQPQARIDETLGVDVAPELATIRDALTSLTTKVQSIEGDTYYRRSMASAANLLTAAADMLESSSRLGSIDSGVEAID